jgi:hypothetical protein
MGASAVDLMPPSPFLFQRYESVMLAGLDLRREVAECTLAAESRSRSENC